MAEEATARTTNKPNSPPLDRIAFVVVVLARLGGAGVLVEPGHRGHVERGPGKNHVLFSSEERRKDPQRRFLLPVSKSPYEGFRRVCSGAGGEGFPLPLLKIFGRVSKKNHVRFKKGRVLCVGVPV